MEQKEQAKSGVRLNKFIASSTGMSRRAADKVIEYGRVRINNDAVKQGVMVYPTDIVTLDGATLGATKPLQTILFNKPVGYIVSRDGQGGRSIYDILPPTLHHLKPVGRLDKDSSGLLLLTNNGNLAQGLTHPSFQKTKVYEIEVSQPLAPLHRQMITDYGVHLEDGPSKFDITRMTEGDDLHWQITMHEGRNRQIRRTFQSLGYNVAKLHRTQFGQYTLPANLEKGKYITT